MVKKMKKKVMKRVSKVKLVKKIKKSKKVKNKMEKKLDVKKFPTLKLKKENDIAMDFAVKAYKKFDKLVKSIILFGSTAKQTAVVGSDIDIILVIDDVSIQWDQELIAWYREELDKIMRENPYQESLHINTIKLSTWWEDLMRGDPVLLNILRNGEAMVDYAGFFEPLKYLLLQGKIRPTPEAIYNSLQRAPGHLARSKVAQLNSIEGLYWAMVDSAHAALIAANVMPPSPEHIAVDLKNNFVDSKKLDMKYVMWYRDMLMLHKRVVHGEISSLKGVEINGLQERTENFISTMANLVKEIVGA